MPIKAHELDDFTVKDYLKQEQQTGMKYEGLNKIIKLQSIGIEISMRDLYLDVNLDLPE